MQTPQLLHPAHRSRHRFGALSLRIACAALLALAAGFAISCGSSGKGLIPAAAAGPLQSDFEAVAQAAQSGEGSCTATEAALAKTEQDFSALPSTVNAGLRNTLHQGIANLSTRARALCAQPLAQNTITSSTPKTTTSATPTTSTPTVTQPTTPTTTPSTTTTTPGPGGGTPAPGAGEAEVEDGKGGKGGGGKGGGGQGGTGPGEDGGAGAGGVGPGGQEAGK